MALVFPSSPTSGQTYSSGSSALYQYDGSKWIIVSPPSSIFVTAASASFAQTASIASTTANSNWISAGTVNSVGWAGTGGGSPNPANTTIRNNVSYRRVGQQMYEVAGVYAHSTSTGASNGSGDYLFTLPGGLSFDTSIASQPIYNSTSTYGWLLYGYTIPNGRYTIAVANAGQPMTGVLIYSSTQYRLVFTLPGTDTRPWASNWYQLADNSGVYASWNFTFKAA